MWVRLLPCTHALLLCVPVVLSVYFGECVAGTYILLSGLSYIVKDVTK
jgi:hypothetical protein